MISPCEIRHTGALIKSREQLYSAIAFDHITSPKRQKVEKVARLMQGVLHQFIYSTVTWHISIGTQM
jgi:hypothetical protein